MRVLQLHNEYFSGLGGEDAVVRLEADLLRARGHEVRQLIVSTSKLKDAGKLHLLQAAGSAVWSREGYEAVAKAVKEFQPDVVHAHNTFPLLSPSVYYAARRNGACVVQTLHNYRITCANGILLRKDVPCEDCVGHSKWRGVVHRCYNGSVALSGAVAASQTYHRMAGTFRDEVDAYVALTSFQRDIVIRDGLPAAKVHIKPNFLPDALTAAEVSRRKNQIVFVGSIRASKGIDLLLEAWTRIRPQGYSLLLLGDGPDRASLQDQYADEEGVTWMGFQAAETVARIVAESKYVVMCSRCYETFGMVMLEAFSLGTPAVVPNHAAFPEIVEGGRCGILFEPSNVESLVQALRRAMSTDESTWKEQSVAARQKSTEYSAEANYVRLMEIYEAARTQYSESRGPARGLPRS